LVKALLGMNFLLVTTWLIDYTITLIDVK